MFLYVFKYGNFREFEFEYGSSGFFCCWYKKAAIKSQTQPLIKQLSVGIPRKKNK